MLKSDKKVLRVIKATEEWLEACDKIKNWKSRKREYIEGNITIYGCEKRNLAEYRQMLGKDKRKLTGRLKELYQAI